MSSLMRSEWGPNWQGCVNRQLAEECLYKRTHSETVLEMRPSLFTTSTPKLGKKKSLRENERKKTRRWMGSAEGGGGGGFEVGHGTTEWSGNRQKQSERERKRDGASR